MNCIVQRRLRLSSRFRWNTKCFWNGVKNPSEWVKADLATKIYPIKPPRNDKSIVDGISYWRGLVAKNNWCPFVNSFGEKYSIEIERLNTANDWMRPVYAFLGNSELNTLLIVLPSLDIPTESHQRYIFNSHPSLIPSALFGEELPQFRRKIAGIDPSLITVTFHPLYGTATWAPWPVIQLVKGDIMEKEENWY